MKKGKSNNNKQKTYKKQYDLELEEQTASNLMHIQPGDLPDYLTFRQGLRKIIVQELCESRGGRPGLSVLTSLLVSMDVKQY